MTTEVRQEQAAFSSDALPSFPDRDLYFVAAEAATAFRFDSGGALLHLITQHGRADMSIATECNAAGLPQQIIKVNVQGGAEDFGDAGRLWPSQIMGVLHGISVATNAAVNDAQPLYVVDVTPTRSDRPFYQQASGPARPQAPGETRLVDAEAACELGLAILSAEENLRDRLARAMQQYVLALRYWTPDTRALAVAHASWQRRRLSPLLNTRSGRVKKSSPS